MSMASSMIRRPAWPERTRSMWPDTRAPACTRACSMIDCAAASCSGIGASIGSALGTVTSARMWMPRRRRAASLAAVATTDSS